MNDSRVPQVTIEPENPNGTPLDGYPSCLVDDSVYLVDDSRVLVGSLTTTIKDIKISADTNAPRITGNTQTQHGGTGTNAPHVTINVRR